MNILRKTRLSFRNRKKKTWTDLNDWTLAFIGAPSFLVGSFYLWVITTNMSDLLVLSRDHGLPLKAVLAFAFLGGLVLSSWFFLTVARRCSELLYERNFK